MAVFPRVVLDEQAVSIARKSLVYEYGGSRTAPWREQLLIDQDGTVFVDYLSTLTDYDSEDPEEWREDLERHRRLIANSLSTFLHNERVKSKYEWLAAYHNDFLRRYSRFLGALADQLRVESEGTTVTLLEFGHDVEEIPEERLWSK